jgi:very-short-patch-repair endonuclease
MSLPEALLWQRLRGSAPGVKFRRQHPVGPYVADFFCREAGLVVELDGQVHDASTGKDHMRRQFLEENGFRVLNLLAADILKDPDAMAASIGAYVAHPLHQPVAPARFASRLRGCDMPPAYRQPPLRPPPPVAEDQE